jgi:hypothetical protein
MSQDNNNQLYRAGARINLEPKEYTIKISVKSKLERPELDKVLDDMLTYLKRLGAIEYEELE